MNSSYEFWRIGCEEFAFGGRELKPPLERRGEKEGWCHQPAPPKSATSQLNAAQLVRVNPILSRTQLDSRKRLDKLSRQ
ncbi:MAG: hypothetical protein OSA93_16890 [Akkermansiaceae bacterium]|jgi:hypothetical protein|nr:hypothetical protein [Akkermansiaceae bacterium]